MGDIGLSLITACSKSQLLVPVLERTSAGSETEVTPFEKNRTTEDHAMDQLESKQRERQEASENNNIPEITFNNENKDHDSSSNHTSDSDSD